MGGVSSAANSSDGLITNPNDRVAVQHAAAAAATAQQQQQPSSPAAQQQPSSCAAAAQQLPSSSSSSSSNSFAVQLRAVQLRGVQCRYVRCSAATQTELSLADFGHDDVIKFKVAPSVADAESFVEIISMVDLWQDGGIPIYTPGLDPLGNDFDPIPGMDGSFHHGSSKISAPYARHNPIRSACWVDPSTSLFKKTSAASVLLRCQGQVHLRPRSLAGCDMAVVTEISWAIRQVPCVAEMRPVAVNGSRICAPGTVPVHAGSSTHVVVVPRGASTAVRNPDGTLMLVTTRDPLFQRAILRWYDSYPSDEDSSSSYGGSMCGDGISGLGELGFAGPDYDYAYDEGDEGDYGDYAEYDYE
jgi:hypothetical protein